MTLFAAHVDAGHPVHLIDCHAERWRMRVERLARAFDMKTIATGGLATLFAGSEIEIVAEAADGNQAVEGTMEHSPDVVLMDIRMLEADGLSALERIRDQSPDTPVVMLSTYDNPTYVARSVALGANDYVLKGSSPEHLINAIQRAAKGEGPATDSVLQKRVGWPSFSSNGPANSTYVSDTIMTCSCDRSQSRNSVAPSSGFILAMTACMSWSFNPFCFKMARRFFIKTS